MAKGYILAIIEIADPAAYRDSGYMAMAEAAVAAHGGRFLVRGGDAVVLEGEAASGRFVILEFPSRETAAAFYASEQYAPAIALRKSLSVGQLVLLSEFTPS